MRRASTRGVTRFELLLGTAACLGAVALGSALFGSSDKSEAESAAATARRIVNATSSWKRETGHSGCPTLSQLIVDDHWERSVAADDPWGGRFLIRCSSSEVEVRSAGSDRTFETEDDVEVNAPWNS
jgi:hypothetical protein